MGPVDEFRTAMSRLVAGVCVVTARAGRHDVASTVTSVISLSLEPPLIAFALHRDARLREAVEVGQTWAVNILGGQGRAAASWLAEPGRPLLDQLAPVPHRSGELSGAAILAAATAWVEVRTAWIVEAGTHDLVAADVLASGVTGEGGAVLHAHGALQIWQPSTI